MTTLYSPFQSPVVLFNSIAVISVLALASALTSEVAFGLEPCVLCIYQRWPFVLAIGLALLGRGGRHSNGFLITICGLLSLTFVVNTGIAVYHSGVERAWWPSFLEGCAVPDLGAETHNILENLLAAPSARCDEIPWADPVFGLSMANYNALLCAVLAVVCLVSIFTLKQRQQPVT